MTVSWKREKVRIAFIGGGSMKEVMVKCLLTKLGSTRTVKKTDKHPADLENMVTSPGGTTTGAPLQLEERRFRSLILGAVAAACQKADRF